MYLAIYLCIYVTLVSFNNEGLIMTFLLMDAFVQNIHSSGRGGEEKKYLSVQGFEPRSSSP
jgi:hypothetical protein